MSVNNNRAEFEDWFKRNYPFHSLELVSCEYNNVIYWQYPQPAENFWIGWKAAMNVNKGLTND